MGVSTIIKVGVSVPLLLLSAVYLQLISQTSAVYAAGGLVLALVLRDTLFSAFIEFVSSEYRWAIAIPIVLPCSFAFRHFLSLRHRLALAFSFGEQSHSSKVASIQAQVKQWDGKTKMCTARPSWLTMSAYWSAYKKHMFKISINLSEVIHIDEKKKTVHVEPLVTCGQLSAALNPLGWTAAVLPELDDLTVGGLVAGFGIETSSFKYGLFQHIVESLEVVTADGQLRTCSRTENADLFYALPWSYGSLGFIVSVELVIHRAKKYVKTEYIPCHTKTEMLEKFEEATKSKTWDFVEALQFSEHEGVVMTGVLTDEYEAGKKNSITRWYKPLFYEHVRTFLKTGAGVDYIPLREYYHRHTRSLFWEMEPIVPFANHWLFRYLLGWLLPPHVAFLKLTTPAKLHKDMDEKHVDQDFLVPMSTLGKCLEIGHEMWDVYPIWLCPCLIPETPSRGFVNPTPTGEEMFVDVGYYGIPGMLKRDKNTPFSNKTTHRKFEEWLREVGGYQALYATTHQTRKEFRNMFDHTELDRLRKKYNSEKAFPEPFDKVSRAARY